MCLSPIPTNSPIACPMDREPAKPKLSVPHSLKISLRRVPIRHHQLAVMSRFLIVHLDSVVWVYLMIALDAATKSLSPSIDFDPRVIADAQTFRVFVGHVGELFARS